MNRGFLIQAQTEEERRQAVALAFSIKSNNKEAQVSLVVGELGEIEEWHEEPFDTIIEYPFQNKINPRVNDWQAWWVTPYEDTIVVDCASLVLQDMTTIWDYLVDYDICFPGTIKDFKGNTVTEDPRYAWLEEYKINYVHAGWFYFKKNEASMDYFKLADPYMQNYHELFKHKFNPQHIPEYFPPDVMHGIVANDMALENIVDKNLYYVDMDISNNHYSASPRWIDYLNVWPRDNGAVKIQNYATQGILCYKEPEFLTEDIFNGQRNKYRVQTKVLREV